MSISLVGNEPRGFAPDSRVIANKNATNTKTTAAVMRRFALTTCFFDFANLVDMEFSSVITSLVKIAK